MVKLSQIITGKRQHLQDKSCNVEMTAAPRHVQSLLIVEHSHIYESPGGARRCIHRTDEASSGTLGASASSGCAITFPRACPLLRLDGGAGFPLSSDHLIPLTQFNAFRATLTNITILSLVHLIPAHCDITNAVRTTPLFNLPLTPPPSLAPTALQQSVPHDTWIDLLPDPVMRDNAIRTMHMFRAEDICGDMLGNDGQGRTTIEMTGVLAWGNPWDTSGWEMTEGFLRKWGFLVKGCRETMSATNYWRMQRGDEPLVFDVL